MTKEEQSKAEAEFASRTAQTTEADVGKMIHNEASAERMMHAGVLCKYLDDVKMFFQLLNDYWHKRYREVPFRTIAAIVGALGYLLSPVDAIPDIIPVLGLVDDAAVIALCLKLVQGDIEDYRQWRNRQVNGV